MWLKSVVGVEDVACLCGLALWNSEVVVPQYTVYRVVLRALIHRSRATMVFFMVTPKQMESLLSTHFNMYWKTFLSTVLGNSMFISCYLSYCISLLVDTKHYVLPCTTSSKRSLRCPAKSFALREDLSRGFFTWCSQGFLWDMYK